MLVEEFFVRYMQPWLPDFVVRWVVRRGITYVNWNDCRLSLDNEYNFAERIKTLSKATFDTEKANEQHYEVPTNFFLLHLGQRLKYSSCEWTKDTKTIEDAEARTVEIYQKNLELDKLEAGSTILEIGNGWGSLCLSNARKYPHLKFYSFSNSATQVAHIHSVIEKENIKNLTTWKQDIDDFIRTGHENVNSIRFNRVVSIECIEHCRAYHLLFKKISDILLNDGFCFFQILGRRYHSSLVDNTTWMGRNFFTGGTVASMNLFHYFNEDLRVKRVQHINGIDYSKTLDAWLFRMYEKKRDVMKVLKEAYGSEAGYRYQSWRMFYLMCSECFASEQGKDWMVGYFTMVKNNTSN